MSMHLFNPRTISRHVGQPLPVPAGHIGPLTEWADLIRSGRVLGMKETALHGDFKAKIVEQVLGYVNAVRSPNHTVTSEQACQSASDERYRRQHGLVRRIPDLASRGEGKLSTALKEWWKFPDFAAFRAEVKKCLKADIPLAERSDWEDWIARDKAEINRLSALIEANERRINEIVYELFDLTPDEIQLLEANI